MDNLTCIWARKKEETTLTGWSNAGIYNTNTIILLQYNTIIYLKRKHTLIALWMSQDTASEPCIKKYRKKLKKHIYEKIIRKK